MLGVLLVPTVYPADVQKYVPLSGELLKVTEVSDCWIDSSISTS